MQNIEKMNIDLIMKTNSHLKPFLQLGEYVSGLTEVHGNVDAQNNINCQSYIAFPKEISDTFGKSFFINGAWSLLTDNLTTIKLLLSIRKTMMKHS